MTTETKVQHTPGPWFVRGQYNQGPKGFRFAVGIGIRKGTKKPVASVVAEEEAEAEANANLIAAAPELLEALKGLIYLTDQGREGGLILSRSDHKPMTNGDQEVIDKAYIAADSAIRKAVGERGAEG